MSNGSTSASSPDLLLSGNSTRKPSKWHRMFSRHSNIFFLCICVILNAVSISLLLKKRLNWARLERVQSRLLTVSPCALVPPAHGRGEGSASHAQLAEMMSLLLNGQGPGPTPGPELLPMLQSVCGQVTKLRLDTSAALAEEKKLSNGSW